MSVLQQLDADALRRWGDVGLSALGRARAEIDALNVFPIPDGDTGTNLFLTVEAGVRAAAADQRTDLAGLTATFARGALLGARGNSGVIVSQLFRGMAESFGTVTGSVQGVEFGAALSHAADLGYAAVARPVEGTVLTVVRAAASATSAAVAGGDTSLTHAVQGAAEAARVALAKTPDQLEVLRRAGVVDAGGRGLVVLLDALQAVVTGIPLPIPPQTRSDQPGGRMDRPEMVAEGAVHGADPGGPAFEVMYLLEADDDSVPDLRARLDELGDSVVVVGGDRLWNVHVHTDDPGSAVEVGVTVGRTFRIRITSLAGANSAEPGRSELSEQPDLTADDLIDAPPTARSVVVVVPGRALADLFESVGATVIIGGPGQRPSPSAFMSAIEHSGANEVIVLPNDPDHVAAAETAAELSRGKGVRIAVVPTRAPVQGLAALAVHDGGRRFDDDVVSMTSAAAATRHGAITVAMREAMTTVGICRAGDVLGLIDGDVAVLGTDLSVVAHDVIDRMLTGGGELVTVVQGSGEGAVLAKLLKQHLHDRRPDVEVVCYVGEQPHYPLLLGVE
ncbi:MAG TPA: DAK2 domain-containing protein [Actinomycetes bacterium]|nr:DAK2 domain-containing protein [Actinomycetes bacterium]